MRLKRTCQHSGKAVVTTIERHDKGRYDIKKQPFQSCPGAKNVEVRQTLLVLYSLELGSTFLCIQCRIALKAMRDRILQHGLDILQCITT